MLTCGKSELNGLAGRPDLLRHTIHGQRVGRVGMKLSDGNGRFVSPRPDPQRVPVPLAQFNVRAASSIDTLTGTLRTCFA